MPPSSWLDFLRQFPRITLVMVLGLVGCSTPYPAPVVDQGEQIRNDPPPIITSDGSANAPRGSITSVSRSAGPTTTTARTPTTTSNRVHRVRRGDTLFSVAYQYDLDFRSLAIANNLSPPYTIYVDQELSLDLDAPRAAAPSASAAATASLGTAVSNNRVASARAAETPTSGTVLRQSIGAARSGEPQWQWPVEGRVLRQFQASGATDKGIDISASPGQPVRAAADGEVVYAGNTIQGSGNLIILRHDDRYLSAYAQNRSLLVSQGARVQAGDTIAEAGGSPEGEPRLHFEIRLDGKPVDPLRYLPR